MTQNPVSIASKTRNSTHMFILSSHEGSEKYLQEKTLQKSTGCLSDLSRIRTY
jgi:hypothetical protein